MYHPVYSPQKSAVAMEAVEGMRDSLWEKEGDVRDKVDDFVTEKKNELINAKQVAITKVNGAYQVSAMAYPYEIYVVVM